MRGRRGTGNKSQGFIYWFYRLFKGRDTFDGKGGFKKRQSGQMHLALAVARARALALSVCASAAARWGSGRPYTPDTTSSNIPAIAVAVGAAGLVNEDGGGLLMTKRIVRTLVAARVETRNVQTIVRG